MFVIGISGQTGAGKSTAAEILSKNGYGENLEVDKVGHVLLKDSKTKQKLAKAFGNDIIDENGEVNRKSLGKKAFTTQENTEKLNSIMHPAMVDMVKEHIMEKESQGEKYIIINAALLFKMKLDLLCDKIFYISAKPETRLKRLVENRGMTEEAAKARLNSQDKMPDCSNNKIAIIDNNGSEKELENKLLKIRE